MMKMEDEKRKRKGRTAHQGQAQKYYKVKETASSPRCPVARASTQASKSVYHIEPSMRNSIQDEYPRQVSKTEVRAQWRSSYSASSLILQQVEVHAHAAASSYLGSLEHSGLDSRDPITSGQDTLPHHELRLRYPQIINDHTIIVFG